MMNTYNSNQKNTLSVISFLCFILIISACKSTKPITHVGDETPWIVDGRDFSKEKGKILEEELNIENYDDGRGENVKKKKKPSKNFSDADIIFRFQLPDNAPKKMIFRDPKYQDSNHGNICSLVLQPTEATLLDDKTGAMSVTYVDMLKSKESKPVLDEFLASKEAKFPLNLNRVSWHRGKLSISKDTMTLFINDEFVGQLVSEGIAHPNKKNISFNVDASFKIEEYDLEREVIE